MGRLEIDSLVEDEIIFEVKGLEPLPRIYEIQSLIYFSGFSVVKYPN